MLKTLSTLIVLASLASPLMAEDAAPEGDLAGCRANPEQCQQARQRMQEKCAANPERCARFKEQAEVWKKKCAEDPQSCEEKKAKLRERLKARRARQQPAG